ncbi:ornithine cyclodeaminase family protein, partial [Bacillus sp. SIMBA_069]
LATDLEEACRSADVIIATTPSTAPYVASEWITPGTHVTAVGADAPGKQELDPALIARADLLVADLASQSLDHGEFATAFQAGLFRRE